MLFNDILGPLTQQIEDAKRILECNERLRTAKSISVVDEPTAGAQNIYIVNPASWHVHNHCAAVMRTYAIFQNFVNELVAAWLNRLPLLYPQYSELPDGFRNKFRSGVAQVLTSRDSSRYKDLSEIEIVGGFYNGVAGKKTYSLLPEAFFADRSNYRWDVLFNTMRNAGIDSAQSVVSDNSELKAFVSDSYDEQTSLKAELDRILEFRNVAAHSEVTETLGTKELIRMTEYVRLLSKSLAIATEDALVSKAIEMKAVVLIGAISHFFRDNIVEVTVGNEFNFKVGMKIAVNVANHREFADILDIEVDHVKFTEKRALVGQKIGLKLSQSPAAKSELLYIPALFESFKSEPGIRLSAYRGDTEPWRIDRLERVKGYICALADQNGNAKLLEKIAELHDHKGDLTVTWKEVPEQQEKDFVVTAWKSAIGDYTDSVTHQEPQQ